LHAGADCLDRRATDEDPDGGEAHPVGIAHGMERVAELLRGRDFEDADVHRAVALASREITERSRHRERDAGVIDGTARAEPAKAKQVGEIAAVPSAAQ